MFFEIERFSKLSISLCSKIAFLKIEIRPKTHWWESLIVATQCFAIEVAFLWVKAASSSFKVDNLLNALARPSKLSAKHKLVHTLANISISWAIAIKFI